MTLLAIYSAVSDPRTGRVARPQVEALGAQVVAAGVAAQQPRGRVDRPQAPL